MKRFAIASLLLAACSFAAPATTAPQAPAAGAIEWHPWSNSIFEQAKRENKFVLLDLEAVWCHWCHVMAETTYKDPKVISLMNSKYIAVKVDQDSRPDLSNRYEDYGWPATVVFSPNGGEIVKRQGYIEPKQMSGLLLAIIKDPSPGPSVRPEHELHFTGASQLKPDLRKQLTDSFYRGYDKQHGSWGFDQKYLDWNGVEYSMMLARGGDANAAHMARFTLDQQRKLIDPAWGGVYQYSVGGDWNEPHFEKIMSFQAEDLRIYTLAYEEWHDPAYLKAAQDIHRFLKTFLMSPDGAFYTSQDADVVDGKHSADYFKLSDAERRKQGVPRVDKHIYARENGWALNSIALLYGATGDTQYRDEAVRAANWIIAHRSLPNGGFRHGNTDASGPYLGDTLSMGRAFLTLYSVTGDRQWLARAESAAKYIQATFRDNQAGYITAKVPTDRAYTPKQERDENVTLARFANLLFRYTGDAQFKQMSDYSMRYLTEPYIASMMPTAQILIANTEVGNEPIHITVVGHKDDPAAQSLFRSAASYPTAYKRVEWWDTREGRLPNPDVQYPELKTAAAFVCTNNTCSAPIAKPDLLHAKVDKLTGHAGAETAQLQQPQR